MKTIALRFALTMLGIGLPACSGNATSTRGAPVDRNLITIEQIRQHQFSNAYEAVQSLRSNWLITKGVDSFASPGQVLVYLDNSKMGGVETLRSIATVSITYIRYYDGITASGRWGLDHGHGVIFVSSHADTGRK
jgi:hypothetical protein